MPRLNSMRLIHLPKISALLLLAFMTLTLSGCFLNDDDDDPAAVDADPTGYYTNSGYLNVKAADNTTQRLVQDVQGMVTDNELMIIDDSENLAYIGTFTVSGNNLNGSVTVYEAGVITAGSKITGTLAGTGVANGSFQLDYARDDNGPVDLGMVTHAVQWRPVVNQNIPNLDLRTATVAEPVLNFKTGGVGSNVFYNCGFDGRMEPITGTHLYTVSVTMKDCNGQGTGVDNVPEYTGLASLRGTDRFILALSNGDYDFSGEYFACLALGCTP